MGVNRLYILAIIFVIAASGCIDPSNDSADVSEEEYAITLNSSEDWSNGSISNLRVKDTISLSNTSVKKLDQYKIFSHGVSGFQGGIATGKNAVYLGVKEELHDITEGKMVWRQENDGGIEDIEVIGEEDVIVAYTDRIFRIKNGMEKWNYSLNASWRFTDLDLAVSDEGTIYVAIDKKLHSINRSGEKNWVYNQSNYSAKAVTTEGNKNYLLTGEDRNTHVLHRIADNGTQIWTQAFETTEMRDVATDGDNIYLAAPLGVRKIDTAGEEIWRYERQRWFIEDVTVSEDGNIYTASSSGIHKINPEGVHVWAYKGQLQKTWGVDTKGNKVYTAAGDTAHILRETQKTSRNGKYRSKIYTDMNTTAFKADISMNPEVHDVIIDIKGYRISLENGINKVNIPPINELKFNIELFTEDNTTPHIKEIAFSNGSKIEQAAKDLTEEVGTDDNNTYKPGDHVQIKYTLSNRIAKNYLEQDSQGTVFLRVELLNREKRFGREVSFPVIIQGDQSGEREINLAWKVPKNAPEGQYKVIKQIFVGPTYKNLLEEDREENSFTVEKAEGELIVKSEPSEKFVTISYTWNSDYVAEEFGETPLKTNLPIGSYNITALSQKTNQIASKKVDIEEDETTQLSMNLKDKN